MLLGHLVEDCGTGGGGRHAVDCDVVAGKLLAERLRQRDHAGLGRGIGAGIGVALLAGDRGDIDDPAIALGDHQRRHRLQAVENAVEVDRENAPPFGDRIVREGRIHPRDAGIVDENVDPAHLGRGRSVAATHRIPIAQIDCDKARADLFRRLRSESPIDVPDRHARIAGDQALGHRAADALGGSGHHRPAAFEIDSVHRVLPDFPARLDPLRVRQLNRFKYRGKIGARRSTIPGE